MQTPQWRRRYTIATRSSHDNRGIGRSADSSEDCKTSLERPTNSTAQDSKIMYDIKNLDNFPKLNKAAPAATSSFWIFDKAAFASGALDARTKQLMAVAVALATQCPYCIEIHVKEARAAGATDQDLAETAMVAAVMRAGAVVTHASHAFKS
jgi:AhpD family alkylhydroperoxidase